MIILTTLITPLIITKILNFYNKKIIKTKITNTHNKPSTKNQTIIINTTQTSKTQPNNIPLYNIQYHPNHNTLITNYNLPSFLKKTINYLFQKLNKLLIKKNSNQSNKPLHNTITSSIHLPQHPILKTTKKHNNSPLQNSHNTTKNSTKTFTLKKFQQHIIYNNIYTHTFLPKSLTQSLQKNNKKLYKFYTNTYTINFKQLTISNFIINYTIHLLNKILKTINPYHNLKYISYSPTKNIQKKTKINTTNQNNISFLFQYSNIILSSTINNKTNSNIPSKKLIIITINNKNHKIPSKLLKTYKNKKYISPQKFLNTTYKLTKITLQKLYKKNKPIINHLPFKIQKTSSPKLYLSLNTKNIINFHYSNIKIQLIPSLLLNTNK